MPSTRTPRYKYTPPKAEMRASKTDEEQEREMMDMAMSFGPGAVGGIARSVLSRTPSMLRTLANSRIARALSDPKNEEGVRAMAQRMANRKYPVAGTGSLPEKINQNINSPEFLDNLRRNGMEASMRKSGLETLGDRLIDLPRRIPGGPKEFSKGGSVRGDGCCQRGKTKGKIY
jgi:hypothetical protein